MPNPRALLPGATCLVAAATSLVLFAQPRKPNATNVLHMNAKPAVVRIISGSLGKWVWKNREWPTVDLSSGSGFIINPSGYILTNAHVVSAIKDGDEVNQRRHLRLLAINVLQTPPADPLTEQNVMRAEQVLSRDARLTEFRRVNLVLLQSGSRYPYEIKAYGAPTGQGRDLITGKDVAVLKIEIKNAPTLQLGDSDDVQVGDQVWVLGYPGAADSDALAETSQLEPTTNDGKISAKKMSADGAPILQTNTSSTHGNSGGPAINEKGEVIGLLTFRGNVVNNQEVQGFNFIVPTNTAKEFVRQAGTENTSGMVDKKWREGLQYYWNGQYTRAKESFAGVLALYQDHSEAAKLIQDSQERIERGEDRSSGFSPTAMVMVAGGAAVLFVLLLAGVGVAVVVLRRKPAAAPGRVPPPTDRHGVADPRAEMRASPAATAKPPVRVPAPMSEPVAETLMARPGDVGRLVCTGGPLAGQDFKIGQGVYIGRDPARSQIVVNHPEISGQHLWVGPANGHAVARDNHSTNGSYLVHDLKTRIGEVFLKEGDEVSLTADGAIRFRYTRAR
jgi:S1-C subfamily serine protease